MCQVLVHSYKKKQGTHGLIVPFMSEFIIAKIFKKIEFSIAHETHFKHVFKIRGAKSTFDMHGG